VPLSQVPYWRLSGFYFFYFACLGVLVPYWSLYLQWEGFSASQIGELTAILLASRIVAPNVWGWIADHKGHRMRIVRSASFAATLVFAGIFIDQSYLWVAGTLLLFSFFWNASLPQFEVTTLQHLGEHSHHYSKVRVWGSVGFIVIVMSLGWLLEVFDPGIVPIALLLSTAGIWLVSGGGSLVKVYGHVMDAGNEETGPVIQAEHYRHWPHGTFVTTAARGSMRR